MRMKDVIAKTGLTDRAVRLYIENGLINIKTSKCKTIELNTERRVSIVVTGENITNAKIDISSYLDECKRNINHHQYIRIIVIDEDGFKAHTRAYFLEELMYPILMKN